VNDALPKEAQQLLNDCVNPHESLLILTAMWENRDQEWSEETLRSTLQAADGIPEALRSLQASGLVRATSTAAGSSYVYAPRTPALDAAVETLVRIYREQPTAVIKFIGANAIQRVRKGALRTFAELVHLLRK
jgi:hypothetical protein